MVEYKRSDRIADQLHREIAELVLRRVKDPRVEKVTITGVEVSRDLQHAHVFYCITGRPDEKERKDVATGLSKATGFIRQELGRRLHMKHLPQLMFKYDQSFDYGEKIERLLKEIQKDEEPQP
ncbi:MAG: 30S ribosome-binding factor RbfA [Syntrophobacteraceae bacterium]|jgi:ribosome-binding factor A|nr:30S ribosome-binding factor RbfA [Syntrophobacteraceae bacterium]